MIPRTCSEVGGNDRGPEELRKGLPLASLRNADAYVLLGDPGMGKTVAFCTEASAPGESGFFIPARDFLTFDLEALPDLRRKTLFIDGLDEVRSGLDDPRGPFDQIRRRLIQLGVPRFRISCRPADWLNANDRDKLSQVGGGSELLVLRLDPLTDNDAVALVGSLRIPDPRQFVLDARVRHLEGFLGNPQSLRLLVKSVAQNGNWPTDRCELFEQACRQLAIERNQEHAVTAADPQPTSILDAAGHLCALQLITGNAGFSADVETSGAGFIPIGDCEFEPIAVAKTALATRLFRAADEGRFEPVHRHLAEFLAGRYLARLVEADHPMRRILALITGPDGGVATSLRGLSAWFATLCPQARADLIRRDPIGVGHYGDVRQFSTGEKTELISSLHREISRLDQAWGAQIAFGPLVSAETEGAIIGLLDNPNPGPPENRSLEFVLGLVSESPPFPTLATALLGAVTDPKRPPYVRQSALTAYIRNRPDSTEKTDSLQRLLLQISTGELADPADEMRGLLLADLYPHRISPDAIWEHVLPGNRAFVAGNYWNFWVRHLVRLSGADELPVLLDRLSAPSDELLSTLHGRGIWEMPTRLLAKTLGCCAESASPERLHRWLSAMLREAEDPYARPTDETSFIRDWIEQHPQIQLAICLECLRSWSNPGRDYTYFHTYRKCLFGAEPPNGYGAWCLAKIDDLLDEHPGLARAMLAEAAGSFRRDQAESGITKADLTAVVDRHKELAATLRRLLEDPAESTVNKSDNRPTGDDAVDPDHQAWLDFIQGQRGNLETSKAGLNILYDLGRAAFGFMRFQSPGGSPRRQLEAILGGDEELVDSAVIALRGAPLRDQVPAVAETLRLKSQSKLSTISFAVLAGLDLIEQTEPGSLDEFSDDQVRNAVAIHFCVPTGRGSEPGWFRRWAMSRVDLVAEVLIEFLISEFRQRSENISLTYLLAHEPEYAELAQRVVIPLLRAFPIRCNLRQIGGLKHLLKAALSHCDRADLEMLTARKLQAKSMLAAPRVNWLAAGVFIDSKKYLPGLVSYLRGNHARTKHLVEFLEPTDRGAMPEFEFDPQTLGTLIELIGAEFRPRGWNGWVTTAEWASDIVEKLISQLRSDASEPAALALTALAADESLAAWAERLEFARSEQAALRRDSLYEYPGVAATNAALRQGRPANAADLAALVDDYLTQIGRRIRTGDTNDWNQYWNEAEGDLAPKPKHEDLCRDALLSDLRQLLPAPVQAEREGSYAFDKRSDIKVMYDGFNLPIEIKKQSHRDLWSAINDQLIAKYTFDSATGGFGVYLVFWFGPDEEMRVGANGHRPRSPAQLKRELIARLPVEKLDSIFVHVVDVSRSRL